MRLRFDSDMHPRGSLYHNYIRAHFNPSGRFSNALMQYIRWEHLYNTRFKPQNKFVKIMKAYIISV